MPWGSTWRRFATPSITPDPGRPRLTGAACPDDHTGRGGRRASISTVMSGVSGGPPAGDPACELCVAERVTEWFHEDEQCWIAECEQCCVPMVVWKRHDPDPSEEVRVVMRAPGLVSVLSERRR